MYICICNNISETQLKNIIEKNSINNVKELLLHNVGMNCKKCLREINYRVKEYGKN